jgi:hypothetical protein
MKMESTCPSETSVNLYNGLHGVISQKIALAYIQLFAFELSYFMKVKRA